MYRFLPQKSTLVSVDRDGKLGTLRYIPTVSMIPINASDAPMPFTLELASNLRQIIAKV